MELLSTGAESQSGSVEGLPDSLRRGNMSWQRENRSARMVPAVLTGHSSNPRILRASAILDCQTGGVIVTHP